VQRQRIDYLGGYSDELRAKALRARQEGTLERRLLERYPEGHQVTNNAALYEFAQAIKREHLRSSPPLAKVRYNDKLSTLHKAFGLHTYAVRVQGANLKSQNEIRIASLFKELPLEFLRMVVVHELAHLRHKDHDKAFYRLCQHMQPEYARLELDLRLLLFARQGDE
jgi:hypothetical protein